MAGFETKTGGPPFPRTAREWMEKGKSAEEAETIMRKDVFGHDYQTDKSGNPIERGKGSALQPTAQHMQALSIDQEAAIAKKMRMGWHPGMEHAYEPNPRARRRKARKTVKSPAEGNA